eukprot:scaffold22688_cov124-Isochrysis_galbana.AAC.1
MRLGRWTWFLIRRTSGRCLCFSTNAAEYSRFFFSRGSNGVPRSLATARQMRTFVSSGGERGQAGSVSACALVCERGTGARRKG